MELQIQESGLTRYQETPFVQGAVRQSPWRQGLRTVLSSKTATVGAAVIIILLLLAIVGPIVAPYNPSAQDLLVRHDGPSLDHLLGTDQYGRDILSRLLHGARISLLISVGAIFLALIVGIPIGLFSGHKGGIADIVIMGLVDILLTFPIFLLAIFVVAITGPSLLNIMLAVAIATLPTIVRIVRGDTLGVRDSEFAVAAMSVGARAPRIVFRHILPNILSSISVIATVQIGSAILVESSLSFLGLGLSPPTPAWGLMINEGLRYLPVNPAMAIAPGVAIAVTVLGFNLFGDGLRDALDPRLRGGNN